MASKICSLCNIEKDVLCFSKDHRNKSGLAAECLDCCNSRRKLKRAQGEYNDKIYLDNVRFSGMREIVLKRDYYMCVRCKSMQKLVVHHIDESGQGDDINNSLENLETLCRSCHNKIHHTGRSHAKKV